MKEIKNKTILNLVLFLMVLTIISFAVYTYFNFKNQKEVKEELASKLMEEEKMNNLLVRLIDKLENNPTDLISHIDSIQAAENWSNYIEEKLEATFDIRNIAVEIDSLKRENASLSLGNLNLIRSLSSEKEVNTFFNKEMEDLRFELSTTEEHYLRDFDSLSTVINNLEEVNYDLVESKQELLKLKMDLEIENEEIKNSFGKLTFLTAIGTEVYYTGYVSESAANGYGVGFYEKAGYYKGEWQQNKRHGEGKHIYANGDTYEGAFVSDLREGYGIYIFKTGEIYQGYWRKDLRDGYGEILDSSKNVVLKGKWEQNEFKTKENLNSSDSIQ